MVDTKKEKSGNSHVEAMFKVGAHFGYTKSRRHPTVAPYIFGAKNHVEIVDLEKAADLLLTAKAFIKKIATERGTLLFVASKSEARDAVKNAALSLGMPYVAGRWIGGTFTNGIQIKKRMERLEDLTMKREKGELGMYTKKERLLIDREIINLERFFGGLLPMKQTPKAMFVIDSKKEKIAVEEARKTGIPVVALCGSDCDLTQVDLPIVGNDSSKASVAYFVSEIVAAYKEGLMTASPLKEGVKSDVKRA